MSEDNIDYSFMKRRSTQQVEQILEAMTQNALNNGFSDPVVPFKQDPYENNVTYSYEQMVDPETKKKEFDMLCSALFNELFPKFVPARPKPRLASVNDAPIESDRPKANLTLVSRTEIDPNYINFDF